MQKSKRNGFTLIEVLIVVVILGILAATVLPQFTASNSDAKESALIQNLQGMRAQIQSFKFSHEGKWPAQGATTSLAFRDAMLLSTDVKGVTGAPGTKPFGPYFVGQLPPNPYTGGRGVQIVPDIDAATPDESLMDGTEIVGWIYSPASGRLKANNVDNGANGVALSKL